MKRAVTRNAFKRLTRDVFRQSCATIVGVDFVVRPRAVVDSVDVAVARAELGEEPQSGAYFVFVGKSWTRVKVLWWDRNGYCLLYNRLNRALFRLPRDKSKVGKTM